MDQARVDIFLDDGWCLISQLHRWLSNWPAMSYDKLALTKLIRGLQTLWVSADDLGLTRLSRTILALEQILERFCAHSLAFTGERLQDVTSGIESLEDFLLGYEATREEPLFANLDSILKLERHSWKSDPPQESTLFILGENQFRSSSPEIDVPSVVQAARVDESDELKNVQTPKDPVVDIAKLRLLGQLAAKLDEVCYRLHVRVLADEAPYLTTTSRLNHLAEATCELVSEMTQRPEDSETPIHDRSEVEMPVRRLTGPPHYVAIEDRSKESSEARAEAPESIPMAASSAGMNPKSTFNTNSSRVLILEDSLFYRHLISIAVRSAGFEAVLTESVEQGIQTLDQKSDFSAIIVGSTFSPVDENVIQRCRDVEQIKVIGLVEAEPMLDAECNRDVLVLRTHPQKLMAILEEMRPADTGLRSSHVGVKVG